MRHKKWCLFEISALALVLMAGQTQAAGIPTGACITQSGCTVVTETVCNNANGQYLGDDIECPNVPTVSTWGLIIMALLIGCAACIVIARRAKQPMIS